MFRARERGQMGDCFEQLVGKELKKNEGKED
jgi:hypothetical protein